MDEKVILIVDNKPRAMCKKAEEDYYSRIFKADKVIDGKFKKGRMPGFHSGVIGIFIANDGEKFIVYDDWSVNRIEDTDAKGYAKKKGV